MTFTFYECFFLILTIIMILVFLGSIVHPAFLIAALFAIIILSGVTALLPDDYEVYLSEEQPLYPIDGKDTYVQISDNQSCTYTYVTENENGRYKTSINADNVYFSKNEGAPVLNIYMRKYKTLWFYIEDLDHYEFCIPNYDLIYSQKNN